MTITKTKSKGPVKLIAKVPSRSIPGTDHTVTFIRKPGMERWTCTCLDQNIIRVAKRQNCYHIKQVRKSESL